MVEQRLARHAVVARRIAGRHAALVAPEDVHARPFHARGIGLGREQLVQRSRFVPKKGKATPVPSWKCADWSADALPANDPARDPTREVI